MGSNSVPLHQMPPWFRQTVRVMGHVAGAVSDIATELGHATTLAELDPRLRADLERVLDALGGVKVTLAVTYMNADRVLREISGNPPSGADGQ